MEVFRIKRGDTSPSLRVALEPATISLIGATVTFQMRPRRGSISIDSVAVIEGNDPPVVRYDWQDGETDTAGIYEAEFRVLYADNTTETFPNSGFLSVVIKEDVR